MMEISEIPGFKIISLFIREENSKIFLKKTEDYKFAELFIDLDFFKNLKQEDTSNKSFERGKYLNYNNDLSYQCIIHKYYPPFNFDIIFLSRDLLFDLRYKNSVNNKILDDTRTIFRCHLKGLQLNRSSNSNNACHIDSNYISNMIGEDRVVTIKVGDVDIYSRILIDILLPNGITYSKHLLEKFPRIITKYSP